MKRTNVVVRHQNECRRLLRHTTDDEQQHHPLSVQLKLTIRKRTCKAGGRIEGNISMFVPRLAEGSDDFSGIHLSLEGNEIVELKREAHPATNLMERFSKNVVRVTTQVASLSSSPLKAGAFEYPFCWQLPADQTLPITMGCYTSGSSASACHVQYNLTAYLSPKTSDDAAATTAQPLKVTAIPSTRSILIIGSGNNIVDADNKIHSDGGDNNNNNNRMIAEPQAFKIKSLFQNKGSIELGLNTDTKVASPNSNIAVTITGKGNLSTVPVKELVVQWVETVQWGAATIKHEPLRESRRVLAEKTISVANNFPQWQKQQTTKNNRRGTQISAIAPDVDHDNNVISMQLPLDISARDSYDGNSIKVQHSISVTAITGGGHHVTNPTFTTTIKVYRQQLLSQESENSTNGSSFKKTFYSGMSEEPESMISNTNDQPHENEHVVLINIVDRISHEDFSC